MGTLDLIFKYREKGTLTRLSPMIGHRVRTNSDVLTSVTAKDRDINCHIGGQIHQGEPPRRYLYQWQKRSLERRDTP